MAAPARVPLVLLPTPLHRLERASAHLGIDLWIKRDDLTGFALGGNKGRKLEYLMAEALAHSAEVVVTCGGAQSNFIRQLGAACAVLGLECAAAAMLLPFPGSGKRLVAPASENANVRLNHILGVDLRLHPDGPWEELYGHAAALAEEYRSRGKRVYEIPIGGSSPLGAYAFLVAGREIQAGPFDWVVCPTSSGSTHVGLAHAMRGTGTGVFGVSCDDEPEIMDDVLNLSAKLHTLLPEEAALTRDEVNLSFAATGDGYGVPSEGSEEAIRWLARTEGIFLDPIYSGKAFDGLLQLVRSGRVRGRVLFWHTGGTPGLFL